MVRMVRSSSSLQFNDYWPMITEVLRHDGGLDIGGVFKFRNEHPIAIPKLLYWFNARAFHGSNVTQGLIVVLVVLTTVAMVGVIARHTPGMGRWSRIAMVVATSFVLFSPSGSWYFVKAMSGSAWLTSFLFVVAAFAAHARGHRFLPIVFAVLGCFTYGTALAVWPALLAAAALRDRSIVRQWPVAITAIVVTGWYWSRYQEVKPPKSVWVPDPTLTERAEGALTTIGSFVNFHTDGTTVFIGAVLVLLGVAAAVLVARGVWTAPPSSNQSGATAWIGLFGFSVTVAVMLSGSRATFIWGVEPTRGRYSIIGAALCLSVLGLVLTALPLLSKIPRPVAAVTAGVAVAAVVVIGLGGQQNANTLQRTRANQDMLQVAMKLNLASGSPFWDGGWDTMPDGIEDLLRDTGQVPFVRTSSLGCGRLGQVVGDDELAPDTPLSGKVDRGEPSTTIAGGNFIVGYVDTGGAAIDCFIVVGDTGRVRGTGGMGVPDDGYGFDDLHQNDRLWFHLLAEQAEQLEVWYRLAGETTFHQLPG